MHRERVRYANASSRAVTRRYFIRCDSEMLSLDNREVLPACRGIRLDIQRTANWYASREMFTIIGESARRRVVTRNPRELVNYL